MIMKIKVKTIPSLKNKYEGLTYNLGESTATKLNTRNFPDLAVGQNMWKAQVWKDPNSTRAQLILKAVGASKRDLIMEIEIMED